LKAAFPIQVARLIEDGKTTSERLVKVPGIMLSFRNHLDVRVGQGREGELLLRKGEKGECTPKHTN
jgi:hypothetical protein